jgi:polyhydroxyalkanoic acid synthase PhaR subunit
MADKESNPDPSLRYQELVTEWERTTDKFFNQLMGTEQFSKSMNQMQQLQLEWQKGFRDVMGQYLMNFNMPTREDIVQVGDDIRELGERIAHIEDQLNKMAGMQEGTQAKRTRPPRTKKPPKKTKKSE